MKITVENKRGQRLCLTNDESKYQLSSVLGHNPPTASISLVDNINDGAECTHTRTSSRNIVIELAINGNVEENRLALYQYIQNGQYIKLYLETNTKSVWIEGIVEDVTPNIFQMKTICVISIVCPQPYFQNLVETVNKMSTIKPMFYFPFYTVKPRPFSIYTRIQILNLLNVGNVSSGMTIEIFAKGKIVNPIIYNRETKEYIGIGNIERPFTMQMGDMIIITTDINNKKIKLIRNAIETNIFNYLKEGSTFLNLLVGDNVFTYSADEGNEYINIDFKHYPKFNGI